MVGCILCSQFCLPSPCLPLALCWRTFFYPSVLGLTVNGSLYFPKMTTTILPISYSSHILRCDFAVPPAHQVYVLSFLKQGGPWWVPLPTGFGRSDALSLLRLEYKDAIHFALALLEPPHRALREPKLAHTERPPGVPQRGVFLLTVPTEVPGDSQQQPPDVWVKTPPEDSGHSLWLFPAEAPDILEER